MRDQREGQSGELERLALLAPGDKMAARALLSAALRLHHQPLIAKAVRYLMALNEPHEWRLLSKRQALGQTVLPGLENEVSPELPLFSAGEKDQHHGSIDIALKRELRIAGMRVPCIWDAPPSFGRISTPDTRRRWLCDCFAAHIKTDTILNTEGGRVEVQTTSLLLIAEKGIAHLLNEADEQRGRTVAAMLGIAMREARGEQTGINRRADQWLAYKVEKLELESGAELDGNEALVNATTRVALMILRRLLCDYNRVHTASLGHHMAQALASYMVSKVLLAQPASTSAISIDALQTLLLDGPITDVFAGILTKHYLGERP